MSLFRIMNKDRKIIFNLAMSLDGYIADENGGFDWIHGDEDKSYNTEKQFSFSEFTDSIDTIIMGKTAFLDCPKETLDDFDKSKKILVASYEKLETNHSNVEFISGNICEQILEVRKTEGKDIWIFGGAELADSFIKEDIIDEYIVGLIPIILGKGVKLFLENSPKLELSLNDACSVTDGIVILRYVRRK